MTPLLNKNELCAALGISRKTLWRRQHGNPRYLTQFEVRQPLGHRRYSPTLVARFTAGQSIVPIGVGSRAMRRAL